MINFPFNLRSLLPSLLCALAAPAWADLSALVVMEPTSRKDVLMLSRSSLEAGLTTITGQKTSASASEDLTDAMRATRSGGYDIFIAPPQVVASAINHGYELVGATDADEQYVLVGSVSLATAAELRHSRIYLPQQDSIFTYMARGMLTANGLSMKDLKSVQYARYPQAGLTAISLRVSEATVIRQLDWETWNQANPGVAKVLANSGPVPGGLSVAIKKDLPPEVRSKVAKWFTASAASCGMKPVALRGDLSGYKRVAQLGTFTPTALPGATLVSAEDVKRLAAQGVLIVDTRNAQEFQQKHIPGAILVPYVEKSLKDVAYDRKLDDFSALGKLDRSVPTIFQCNGPECWKSYKASREALAAGFTKVYWFRGGMPEWEAANPEPPAGSPTGRSTPLG
jgi:rhodanese-related sulfurtransferase/ABC-type phosphate/phosphonate transport system substrate-binding protein